MAGKITTFFLTEQRQVELGASKHSPSAALYEVLNINSLHISLSIENPRVGGSNPPLHH
jgi:hypothetical protein